MSLDYNAPAELFLAKRTKNGRKNYRRFATAAEAIRYAVEDLRTPKAFGALLEVGDELRRSSKSSAFTKHCASLSDRAPPRSQVHNKTMGPPFPGQNSGFRPTPAFQKLGVKPGLRHYRESFRRLTFAHVVAAASQCHCGRYGKALEKSPVRSQNNRMLSQ